MTGPEDAHQHGQFKKVPTTNTHRNLEMLEGNISPNPSDDSIRYNASANQHSIPSDSQPSTSSDASWHTARSTSTISSTADLVKSKSRALQEFHPTSTPPPPQTQQPTRRSSPPTFSPKQLWLDIKRTSQRFRMRPTPTPTPTPSAPRHGGCERHVTFLDPLEAPPTQPSLIHRARRRFLGARPRGHAVPRSREAHVPMGTPVDREWGRRGRAMWFLG